MTPPRHNQPFNEQEDAVIRAGNDTTPNIARKLGRTVDSIRHRARQLGIPNWYENRWKLCRYCGKNPRYRTARCRDCYYAALRQRRAAHRKIRATECKHCHTPLLSPSPYRRFCSRRCVQDAKNARERKLGPVPASRLCKRCHNAFCPTKQWHFYCSQECLRVARNDRLRKGTRKEKRIQVNCQSCGKEFTVPVRHLKRRNPKFCSLQCAYRERRGDKSPKFRGGSISYRGAQWLRIAEEIRARDEFLCKICNGLENGRRKHCVDHVIPFRLMEQWGLDPNHYDNLMTMCDSCHGKKQSCEDRLVKGDLIGFILGLLKMQYPVERVRKALRVAELSASFLDYRVRAV